MWKRSNLTQLHVSQSRLLLVFYVTSGPYVGRYGVCSLFIVMWSIFLFLPPPLFFCTESQKQDNLKNYKRQITCHVSLDFACVGQADTFSLKVTRLLLPHAVTVKKLFRWEFEWFKQKRNTKLLQHLDIQYFSCNLSVKNGNYRYLFHLGGVYRSVYVLFMVLCSIQKFLWIIWTVTQFFFHYYYPP